MNAGQAAGAEFTKGQEVIWTGLSGKFARRVRIVDIRNSYLAIFGQRPEDGETVYDISDPIIKGTVYGIPADQLSSPVCKDCGHDHGTPPAADIPEDRS